MRHYILLCMIALSLCIILSACTTAKQPQALDALYYFQKGEVAFEDENYTEAIEHWQKVRDSFTSPELTELAELKIADAQFKKELYIEAIASYEDFLKQHPSNLRKSDVLLHLGKAHFEQILAADRDQTATRNALSTFEQLHKNFPGKIDTQELNYLILQCRDRLAENETYVGNFYLKTKHYKAAISRLEKVRCDHPEFYDMGHVLLYLAQAHQQKGETDLALALLNEVANYNNNDLNKEAAKLRHEYNI
ncbi:MAG: outer membrane protein assembly factor BamD [Thermodesulfobacteriota bacterium]|nr:outer membrane protein assembly factor BamD [Thermodesulfobacteriota bacterium]